MTDFPRWSPSVLVPPDTARSKDGRLVRLVPNPAVPVPRTLSTPLLAVETSSWSKAPTGACFPIHPLGVMELYARGRALLADTGLFGEMLPEQLSHAETCMWRFAGKLFKAGQPIRACIDAMVDDRGFQIRQEDDSDPFAAQPAYLAAWCVLRAALDWAQEAVA